ncbi:MAG: hypothetical protein JWM43_4181 [Acidobacteriaceae bacterium]|nr:hypothetical protein [Acidobacteriaceae bacterium]
MTPTARPASRVAAAAIALITWFALGLQCVMTYQQSLPQTLWIVFAYFTITTNLIVAAVFTALAFDRTFLRREWVVAGTMLSILLVGVIYALLLHGMVELSGGSALTNMLLHMVTPILVPLYWIAFTPKGHLSRHHPPRWAVYPLAYLAYALVRGSISGQYPYPFVNVIKLGWGQTALNAVIIAAAFLFCSYALVFIDSRIGHHQAA